MGRIIALRWADGTESCLTFLIDHTLAMRNMIASNKYSASTFQQSLGFLIIYLLFLTIQWLSHCLSAIPRNSLALHKLSNIHHNLSVIHHDLSVFHHDLSAFHHDLSAFHHFLAFPEGDKLLIGHGWPEWRPKGDMTCLPCLSSRRMDELCRSSTGVHNRQRIAPTISIKR